MRRIISVIIVILACIQMVLSTIAYNQLSAEETSVYKYHLLIVLFTLPLLLFEILVQTKWRNCKILRIYLGFIMSILLIHFLHQLLNVSSFNLVRVCQILYPFLFITFIYSLSSKGTLNARFLDVLAIVIWSIFVIVFITGWTDINVSFDLDARGMNNIYYVLFALPFCQSNNNRKIRLSTLAVTGILCFLSLKRGAIIGYLLAAYFFASGGAIVQKGRKIVVSVLTIILLVLGYYYLDKMSGGYITYRFKMEDVHDTGRNDIYAGVLNALSESSVIELLIGHGMDAVKNTNEHQLTAHNDYLEIIFDYGIVPLAIWVCFFYYILKYSYQLNKRRKRIGGVLLGSCCIFFVMSMVSHVFFMSYSCALFLYWGCAFHKKSLLLER